MNTKTQYSSMLNQRLPSEEIKPKRKHRSTWDLMMKGAEPQKFAHHQKMMDAPSKSEPTKPNPYHTLPVERSKKPFR